VVDTLDINAKSGAAIWLLCALCASGCNTPSDQPELAPVSGVVTLDGKPLANKTVIFTPPTGRPSMGTTNEEGEYELRYTMTIEGAIIGTHDVTITTPRDEYNPGIRETIPRKFNSESTLTAVVEDKWENTIDFDLKSE
jgi:hypothetical protein